MASISTTFSIRPVRREELEAWVDLANQSRYWQEDAAGTFFDDSLRPPEEPLLRLAAWAPEEPFPGSRKPCWARTARGSRTGHRGWSASPSPIAARGLLRSSPASSRRL